jgi:hypothetical protein
MSTYDPNKRKPYPQKARERIKAGKILTKLQDSIIGVEGPEGDLIYPELDAQQVAAARILLGKVLPDLKATEFVGSLDTNVKVENETIESATASVIELLKQAR